MSKAPTVPARFAGLFRAGLLGLGAVQTINGLYAVIAPRSFFEDFPLGRGWVAALPDYSEHLVRDVGGLFLATAVILIAAGIYLERRLVGVALVSFLAFSIPHAVFHFLNLEPYEAGDAIANVVGLGAMVGIPTGLLFLLGRPAEPRPASRRAAPGSAGSRVEGVPDSTRNPLVRYAYRQSRSREGEVMDPLRVFAHNPTVMMGYGIFELASERSQRVPERIKHLALLRAAMLCGCEWCLDYGSAISAAANVSEEDLRALPTYRGSDRFDAVEILVLDYASAISATPAEVSDELFAQLREHFDEPQLVELTSIIALENYRARFNWAFGLAGQGYADGAYCVRPEAAARAPAPTVGGSPD